MISFRKSIKMPPKKAGGRAKKTASGYRMPDHLDPGTVLTDLIKKQVSWLSLKFVVGKIYFWDANAIINIVLCSVVGPGQDGRHRRVRGDLPRHRGREG